MAFDFELGLLGVFVFVIGACIGSFLNVCIYRLPREISIVQPPSFCASCDYRLPWYDNVPVLAYLYLRGRCRRCGARYGLIHPAIELLTGFAALAIFYFYRFDPVGWVYFGLICALIVVSAVDLKFRIIPDEISVGFIPLGLVVSVLVPQLHGTDDRLIALGSSALGLLVGGGVLYLTAIFGDMIFRKESMGGGDIKLLAMAGTVLGWKTTLLAFFIAPMIAIVPGVFMLVFRRSHVVAFGPFLSLGMLIALWGGDYLLQAIGLKGSYELLREIFIGGAGI